MGEDDIVKLLWKSDQVLGSSQTQGPPSSDKPSPPPPPAILRGSGSGSGSGGDGEGNAPLPLPQSLPPVHHQQQPYPQNLFIHEDEMASWLHHQSFSSGLLYSGVSFPLDSHHPQSSVSLAPPPGAPYDPPSERPTGQIFAARGAENFMTSGNVFTGGRVEAGQWIPVVRASMQMGSSATQSFSATGSSLTPATEGGESRRTVIGGVSHTFAVPSLSRREKTVAIETVREIAGTSSSGVSKAETVPSQIQPATETEIPDDRKRKEREETFHEIEEAEEAGGSISRKRSRAAEMHNISERRRREKINEKMKALQELIPRCHKSDKASMLDDAIEYVKSLQMQIQMMSTGYGMMPTAYTPNMLQFMAMRMMGMMGMSQPPFIPFPGTPFPRHAHLPGPGPSFPSDPFRVFLPSQQPNPMSNHMKRYSQGVGLQQMQQPAPVQIQTTSPLSFGQASSSKEPEDQDNQPTG